jgi:hypothetical protein
MTHNGVTVHFRATARLPAGPQTEARCLRACRRRGDVTSAQIAQPLRGSPKTNRRLQWTPAPRSQAEHAAPCSARLWWTVVLICDAAPLIGRPAAPGTRPLRPLRVLKLHTIRQAPHSTAHLQPRRAAGGQAIGRAVYCAKRSWTRLRSRSRAARAERAPSTAHRAPRRADRPLGARASRPLFNEPHRAAEGPVRAGKGAARSLTGGTRQTRPSPTPRCATPPR